MPELEANLRDLHWVNLALSPCCDLTMKHVSRRFSDGDQLDGEVIPEIEGIVSGVAITGFEKTIAVGAKQRVDLAMSGAESAGREAVT